jgi:hypothetical protein
MVHLLQRSRRQHLVGSADRSTWVKTGSRKQVVTPRIGVFTALSARPAIHNVDRTARKQRAE